MTTRRKDDETVPDRVLERQPRPDVKRCAYRIQHTSGHDKNNGRFRQRSEQRRNEEQPLPAEQEIDNDRQAFKTERISQFRQDAAKRFGP